MRVQGKSDGERGVIMADALVGVVIASLMIGVCLGTLNVTRSFWHTADDTREATRALTAAFESVPRVTGHYVGRDGAVTYVVNVTEERDRGIRLCRLLGFVRPAHGRAYRLSGTRWCAPEGA